MLVKKYFRVGLILTGLCEIILTNDLYANMPVFDALNLAQNIAIKLKQIDQYKNQLNQYKTMLENSKKLDSYTWSQANTTIDNLLSATNALNQYKAQAGSMDAYLSRFQNADYYRSTSCFNGNCSQAELNALHQHEIDVSKAQKYANDAMLRGIEQQQLALKKDANQLTKLQQQSQTAEGQMAAIQAANQLASEQTNQLMQIRGLLITEQTAAATRASVVADREALQAAADERFRAGSFQRSIPKSW
ncbi:P-type conjugative transfer protein TrbJ [Legionella fairfieldensis]|uniref:P-type conjugative transfer protein TrbJ n=1 Tax=Legionella fairfieldensis TaxID=45064 RepID=UPI0006877754|nr:P-type conjugative transfer protein TrbJ [Legionella fairfieldensis]